MNLDNKKQESRTPQSVSANAASRCWNRRYFLKVSVAAALGTTFSRLPLMADVMNRFPDYQTFAKGPWQPVLLSGQRDFVFTINGSDPGSLQRLVTLMREKISATDLIRGLTPGQRISRLSISWQPLVPGANG